MAIQRSNPQHSIEKSPSGIPGLDEITEGGLPKGRPTLVCGAAGCGKTVLGMEFLVRGARDYDEPGVFMAFEETTPELEANFASMDFDVPAFCARKKLYLEHVRVERHEIEETGEYDLEGLFIRLQAAIDKVGAKRVVLDTIESLFSGFQDTAILRGELRRLFRWLKDKRLTAIITAESGDGKLTRYGLEEYVADCVIDLDHRVVNQSSIRCLRIVKYRGSKHETNEYPFLIGRSGFSVLPLTSLLLTHKASQQRISSGIPRLDEMLGGKGFYRGSSVLVSGGAGTGKSSIGAHFAQAACQRGERALVVASEQSSDEIIRNMRSIGINLKPWVKRGLLCFHVTRAGFCGLEKHLLMMSEETAAFAPKIVVVDPITNYSSLGSYGEVKSMLTRLIDMFKAQQITALFTSLTPNGGSESQESVVGISSLMDTWIQLRNLEMNGERNRAMYVLKARGLAHSNQVREFLLTDHGAQLVDVYVGPDGVLTGSARAAQEARDRVAAVERTQVVEHRQSALKHKRLQMEAQVAALHADIATQERELQRSVQESTIGEERRTAERVEMARLRQVGSGSRPNGGA